MKRFTLCLAILLTLALALTFAACKAVALDAPTGLAYEDGILSWAEVKGADRYAVEVDDQVVAEVRTTSYLYDVARQTTFRVKAIAQGKRYTDSPYSEAYVYRPNTDTRVALNAPTIYEVNGAGLLTWSYVVGATGYRIYLNGSVLATVGTDTQYTLTVADTGAYSVQVQAIGDDTYRDSPRSAIYRVDATDGKIKAPALRAPTANYNVDAYRVEWTAVNNAVRYEVYQNDVMVQSVAADDAHAYTMVGTARRYFYAPAINVRNTRIYVVAIADGTTYSNSSAGNVLAFPLQNDGAPTSLSTSVVDGQVYLTWDKLTNAIRYRVRVERDDVVVGNYIANTNRFQLSLDDGTYRVSVAGDGDDKVFSPTEYCAQIEVTFVGRNLQPHRLDTPQNLHIYKKAVRFDAVPNATAYTLTIDTPYDDEQGEYTYTLTDTYFDIPSFLYCSVITVYVRAMGEDGYANSLLSSGVCYYPVNDDPDIEDYIRSQQSAEEGEPDPDAGEAEPNPDQGEGEGESAIGEGDPEADPENGGDEPSLITDDVELPVFPNYSLLLYPLDFALNGDTLTWNAADGAAEYELSIDGITTRLNATSYPIDLSASHVCRVRSISATDNVLDSCFGAELYVSRTRIDTPQNLILSGHVLRWETVAGSSGYVLQINDEVVEQTADSIDLERALPYDGTYTIRLYATAANAYNDDSLYSQTVTFVADYEQEGTEHKPYKLSTVQDFAKMIEYPTAYFALENNVEVGEISALFSAQYAFAGSLDGRGHTLSGIALVADSSSNGLLGCLYNATIANVTFDFASVAFNDGLACGVLAAEAQRSTFTNVAVRATATAGATFATVGVSEGCIYTDCRLAVTYTQTSATASLGGLVATSRGDTFEGCRVSGSLSGGMYVGALAATASNSTVTSCTVGGTDAFAYTVCDAYAGAVGMGTLEACSITVNATYAVSGNAFVGGVAGQLTCPTVSGTVNATFQVDTGSLYVGGMVGFGSVDRVDVQATVSMTGSAGSLFGGGLVGYAQGLNKCSDTTSIALTVDLAAPNGRYFGGAVGFGPVGIDKNNVEGNLVISSAVSVGRQSGIEPTATEAGWTVVDKE